MKVSRLAALCRVLRQADPLPTLAVGYLFGLISAVGAVRFGFAQGGLPLTALPARVALYAMFRAEFPVVLAILLVGTTRHPLLCRLPILYRGLLWGYGSLTVYLSVGQSLFYFRYVLATGATLLPLCCLSRLSAELAGESGTPDSPRLFEHISRCLFYFGLILLTLPLRL
ncbi:MAG: hypothetical protein ACI3YH_07295 [Eubacteriales bacterium]